MANRRPDAFLWIIAAALVVGAAAWLRFHDLGHKIIHADEAVQGWKTGLLMEGEGYTYDPGDHHGPTLYFLAAPMARLRGENSLADLSVTTLRLLPAFAGVGVVVVTVAFGFLLGRRAALGAAAFTALSPMLVFYSRHFVQEMLLVLFAAVFLLCIWRWIVTGVRGWLPAGGFAFGLMVATKETWLIVAFATAAGLVAAAAPDQEFRDRFRHRGSWLWIGASVLLGLFVAAAMYSSGFTNLAALKEVWAGLLIGSERATDGGHAKPWSHYLDTLLWTRKRGFTYTELGVLFLALLTVPLAFGKTEDRLSRAAARFLGIYTLVMAVVYTVIPYKTIWLFCGVLHGLAILAGIGADRWLAKKRPHLAVVLGCAGIAAIALNYGVQAHRASTTDANRPWNPYAYVETSSDLLRLPGRIEAISSAFSESGDPIIKIAMPNFWPIPWLLRGYNNVGFWTEPDFDPSADVLIVSAEWYEHLAPDEGGEPGVEIFGVRDGELAVMVVERDLWERSLEDFP